MFLAIDRVSKFTYVEFRDDMGKMNGADFLRGAIQAFLGMHIFGRVCNENGIVHKLTKPYHPWTNGQAERMDRTIKKATIKAFHCPNLESLQAHVLIFV